MSVVVSQIVLLEPRDRLSGFPVAVQSHRSVFLRTAQINRNVMFAASTSVI